MVSIVCKPHLCRITALLLALVLALILLPAQTARADILGPPCDECGGSTIIVPGDWNNHYIMCQDSFHVSCSMRYQLVPQSHEGEPATCISGAICTICGQEYSSINLYGHAGGTATCVSGPICSLCGREYGAKNTNNHDWGDWTRIDSGAHIRYCKNGCGKYYAENHTPDRPGACRGIDAVCTKCGSPCLAYNLNNHTGPITPATCTAAAYCSACGRYFGRPDPDAHTPGEPVREDAPVFIGMYYEVVYCTECGQELSRTAYAGMESMQPGQDPFSVFCEYLALRITNAQPDEVLELDARQWYGLQWRVLEALAARPDVSLKLLCYVNETAAQLTIPAGFDLISSLEPGQFLHFRELAKMLG